MATLEKIQEKLKKLQAQAEALLAKKSQDVLSEIRSLMEKHGLTTADIDAHAGGKRRGRKPVVKSIEVPKAAIARYQDPKTGATWSGRGRAPAWIAKAKDRSRFLVSDSVRSLVVLAGAGKVKKVGNYPRGPQPAKYLDPKTGATWSGRGRTPAWLIEVRDRSEFLIAGAADVGAPALKKATGVGATGKAVSKKPRAASKKAAGGRPAVKTAVAETQGIKKSKSPASQAAVSRKPAAGVTRKVVAKKFGPEKAVNKSAPRRKAQTLQIPDATVSPAMVETSVQQVSK